MLIGQAVGIGSSAPIKQTPVYLAQIHWDGEAHQRCLYRIDSANSPATLTDQNGYFSFAELPAGQYAIVVGESDGNNDVVREGNGNARIFYPSLARRSTPARCRSTRSSSARAASGLQAFLISSVITIV